LKEVVFVINGFPTYSETFIVNSILNAKNNGLEVRVLPEYVNDIDSSPTNELIQRNLLMNLVSPTPTIPESFKKRAKLAALDAFRRGTTLPLLRSINPLIFGKDGTGLRNYFRTRRFSPSLEVGLVHSHFGPNGVLAVNAKLIGLHDAPVITTFHGYDTTLDGMSLKKRRKYYRNLFNFGDWFTVNGPYLKSLLVNLGCPPDKISCIPMGVDTEFFHPPKQSNRPKKDEIKLISVGRLIPLKGHIFGIKCAHNLVQRGHDVHYTIVGDGPEMSHLESEIAKRNLSSNVTLTGKLTPVEIRDLLQKNDIFLMTSTKDHLGRCETQGVVTLEAQACGLPVVGFRNGGIPDTIIEGQTGFLAEDKNDDELARKVEIVVSRKEAPSFSQNARRFSVSNYDQKRTNEQFTELYSLFLN
jgi:colanic acid/amylovoran biosynthesis glycosyltransferase